jgi:hypothetical protein
MMGEPGVTAVRITGMIVGHGLWNSFPPRTRGSGRGAAAAESAGYCL